MLLSSLIKSSEGLKLTGLDVDISGLTSDSRNVKPGFLFIAIPGTKEDGSKYIKQAIERGAVAVVVPESEIASHPRRRVSHFVSDGLTENGMPAFAGMTTESESPISIITTPNIRKATSVLASKFYPRQPETIAAITGTSGKTSTAQFVREIWQALGHKSASIGTLGLITADESHYGSLTTPDPIALHQSLDDCAGKGITHLALEASSHGLALHRLDHVRVQVAGFTNLSRDHLDFHPTMEDYLQAKLRLFTEVMAADGTAVLNADIPEYDTLVKAATTRGLKVISYGLKGKDIKLIESKADTKGQHLKLQVMGTNYDALLPVMGGFQVWNALCAMGIVIGSGAAPDKAVAALNKVTDVPGRLQLAGISKNGGTVFIDYAHKPDALENVLKAVRPHVAAHQAKLGVIFGCGGERDPGKRPIMGEIATRLADWIIVTDDNPRHEDPIRIRQEILSGCKAGSDLREISDRAEAIKTGIDQLQKGDVLIIAGKGHEPGQIVGDKTLPFDDTDVARKVLGL